MIDSTFFSKKNNAIFTEIWHIIIEKTTIGTIGLVICSSRNHWDRIRLKLRFGINFHCFLRNISKMIDFIESYLLSKKTNEIYMKIGLTLIKKEWLEQQAYKLRIQGRFRGKMKSRWAAPQNWLIYPRIYIYIYIYIYNIYI